MEGRWLHKEDRWKDRALCLQHRLRDRFRVVVDQHRRRQRSSGYVSSVMQRWIQRFRHFRSQTLANSSTFYRKRVSNDFDTEEDSILTQILQAVVVPIIGNVCHVFMHGLNDVQIYGGEKLQQALVNRTNKTPLITVSNHIASMDDPLVISALLPKSVLLDARNLRWTLCATDRCFRNPVTSTFFNCVKVLPVSRGEGIYQKAVAPEMVEQLLVLLKEVLQDNAPMVVPFVHGGMQEMMPIGATFPTVGKRVTILVGDPIDFKDVCDLEQGNMTPRGNLDNLVLDQHLDTEGYDCNNKQDNQKEYFSYKGSGIVPSTSWVLLQEVCL